MSNDRPVSPLWNLFVLYADAVERESNRRGGLISNDEKGFVLVSAALLVLAHELHGGDG